MPVPLQCFPNRLTKQHPLGCGSWWWCHTVISKRTDRGMHKCFERYISNCSRERERELIARDIKMTRNNWKREMHKLHERQTSNCSRDKERTDRAQIIIEKGFKLFKRQMSDCLREKFTCFLSSSCPVRTARWYETSSGVWLRIVFRGHNWAEFFTLVLWCLCHCGQVVAYCRRYAGLFFADTPAQKQLITLMSACSSQELTHTLYERHQIILDREWAARYIKMARNNWEQETHKLFKRKVSNYSRDWLSDCSRERFLHVCNDWLLSVLTARDHWGGW